MTPDPKSAQFIKAELPIDASIEMKQFAENLYSLQSLANELKIEGINSDSFCLEYNTYDHSLGIRFRYIDGNNHQHTLTAIFTSCEYKDGTQSYVCDYNYLFKADNFEESIVSVNSFAEDLMLNLWNKGIDAELSDLDWGLTFTSSIDDVSETIISVIEILVSSIKPMSWFNSDTTGWRFHSIYSQLNEMLPLLQHEATIDRWPDIKSSNFIIDRNSYQAKIKLTYREDRLFEMIFSLGLSENGFDPDISGEWMECEYQFNILTQDEDFKSYLETEHSQFFQIVTSILDGINYKSLFAYGENDKNFVIIVKKEWALKKFCLMLDVMMPLRYRYKVNESYIPKTMLKEKSDIEDLLGIKMDIVEDDDSKLIFNHGYFLEVQEPIHISYLGDCPF